MAPPSRLRFEGFTFDPATGELHGPDGDRRLQPQPAAVLALLASRRGELVSREEIRRAVWPDTAVEADEGINFCIRQVRAALGESAGRPRFVETLPKRGYRFLVPVEPVPDEAVPDEAPAAAGRGRRIAVAAAVAALLGLLALAVAVRYAPRAAAPPPLRVVLLPLADPDPGAAALASFNRALGEALVVELTAAGGERFAVIGPATTAPYVARGRTPAEIGAALDADFVLSGGARAAESVVFLQVVRRSDGAHVFAERFPLDGRSAEALAAEAAPAAEAALHEAAAEERR